MSDKERKLLNTLKDVACGHYSPEEGTELILSDFAVECRAPAPQPAAIATLQNSLLGHDSEEDSSGNIVMRFNCGEWLDIAMAVKSLAATPQVTPWKAHFTDSDVTGDIHNYVDTGDGKRLWAQDADEIVKRHNEGTSEQAPQELELEQEADGRWLAEFTRFPGVAAYGPSREEAIRNAAKVLIESEPASPDPFSKGYKHREGKPVSDACGEGMHAECTQDLTKCHCTFRTGHTVLHAYMNPKLASEQASPTPELGTCQDHHATITPSTPHARTPYCCEWRAGEVERG